MKLLKRPVNFIKTEEGLIIVISFFFLTGFIFHILDFSRSAVVALTDIFLLLAGCTVLFVLFRKTKGIKILIWSGTVFIISFLIEYLGVKTGNIFGSYVYGDAMNWKIGGIPPVIALNWTILILATNSIALSMRIKSMFIPVISSVLIVIFDFIMEPVAIHLNYWHWSMEEIPLQNYLAWFTISFFFSFFLSIMRIKPESKLLRFYFFIQVLFFLFLNIFLV